jgi:hypothetical protein
MFDRPPEQPSGSDFQPAQKILKDNRLAGPLRPRGGMKARDAACSHVSDILALTALHPSKRVGSVI